MNLLSQCLPDELQNQSSSYNSSGDPPLYLPDVEQYSVPQDNPIMHGAYRCDKCPAVFMIEVFYELHKKKHLESESVMIPRDPGHQAHHHYHNKNLPPKPAKKSAQKLYKSSKKQGKYVKGLHCLRCQITARSFEELVSHMTQHTSSKEPSQCGNCDYQTMNRGNFKRHLMSHGNVRPFKCYLCPFWARQKSHLTKHLKYHGGNREFKCSECNYSCSDKFNFHRHKNLHPSSSDEQDYRCTTMLHHKPVSSGI